MNYYQKLEAGIVNALGIGTESESIKARLLIRFSLAFLGTKILFLFLAVRADVTWFKIVHVFTIATVPIVFVLLKKTRDLRVSVATFIGINLIIMSVSLVLMGGQIQTINNAWFALFLILAYLMLGQRFGLFTVFFYTTVVLITFLLCQAGYLVSPPEPLGGLEHEFYTAATVILFAFLIYILLNGLNEIREDSEKRLAFALNQEKKHVEVMLRNQRDLLKTIEALEGTQKALQKTTEQLEQSQIISRQGNFEVNLVTGARFWSKMTPVLFHYPPGTLIESVDLSTLVDPHELAMMRQHWNEVRTTKRPVQYTFKITNPKNGRIGYIELRNFPVEDDAGNVVCIRGSLRDCTIEELYNQSLVTQKEAAEAATKAKATFLSTMSHEIRTPMNAVIGLAQLLLMEQPRPDQLENLGTLHQAANHLLGLLNDILDYSKIEAQKIELEKMPVSVNVLLDEVHRLLALKATDKGLRFEVESSLSSTFTVLGDPLRLKQILTNLASNSIKFTNEGHVLLNAGLSEGGQLHISVKDSGIGIREEDLGTIFESFSQASGNITRQYGGTGLGLSICKGLVETMGGTIWVESQVGKGSEFHIQVPLAIVQHQHPLPVEIEPHTDTLVDLSTLNVLLVEDNPVNVMVAKKALNTMGITKIAFAENGLLATEMAAGNRYDLILMDLQMPVMDGLTASMNIRKMENPNKPRVPIIALTASASSEVKHSINAIGINGIATKPFIIKELEMVIRDILPSTVSASEQT